MPTEFPEERHLAPDPELMEAARARGQARWAPAGDLPEPEEKPPGTPLKRRIAAIALVATVLVVTGLSIVFLGGGGDGDPGNDAQPSHSYIPGLITPPEALPDESSSPTASIDPTLASSALGLMPTTTVPGQAPAPENPGARVPPAPSVKSVTAGPGCGGFTGVGRYSDGKKGWVDHGSGCGGAFTSIPMSGDSRRDDASAYGMWKFDVSGNCDLSVLIPSGDLTQVGGNPTVYYVFDRDGVSGTPMASFAIKQVDQRGRWVHAGKFRAGGKLTVQLLTRGQDWNSSGPTYAHHAAGAVKADCTA